MSLWRKKSIEALCRTAAETGEHSLKRVLGARELVMLGVGGIIGTGIFVLTGQVAAQYSGPAVILSFIVAAIVSGLAALCYAEFASAVPVSGSAYTYGYATLGEFVAWLIGWDLILEYALGAATVASSWSGYFLSTLDTFGIPFPRALAGAPGTMVQGVDGSQVEGMINLPAMLVAFGMTLLLIRGISESAKVNNVIVYIKLFVIFAVVAAGLPYINLDHFSPMIPENTGTFGEFGWSGVARGASVIFFAYIGFDAVSTTAQEAKNPQRDMPIGILGSLGFCTVLYVLVSFVLVGLVPHTGLNHPAPMAVAIDAALLAAGDGPFAAVIRILPVLVKLGALAGLTSVLVVLMLGQPRILFAMATDGLLPAFARRVHPRFRTPYVTTMITGGIVAGAAGFTPITVLGEMVSIGTLFAFVIVALGVLVSRYTQREVNRPFKVPFVPFVPVLWVIVSTGLILSLPHETWIRLFVWMAIGVVIYFAFGRKHSVLGQALTPPAASVDDANTLR